MGRCPFGKRVYKLDFVHFLWLEKKRGIPEKVINREQPDPLIFPSIDHVKDLIAHFALIKGIAGLLS